MCEGEWHYFCAASKDLVCAFTLSHVRNLADLESFIVQWRVDIILFDMLFSSLGFGICPIFRTFHEINW